MAKGRKAKQQRNRKDYYEVSEIIGHDIRTWEKKKQLFFLIKWKIDGSLGWEPIKNLDRCLESVTDYIEGKNESSRLANNAIYKKELYSTRSPIKSVHIRQGKSEIFVKFEKPKKFKDLFSFDYEPETMISNNKTYNINSFSVPNDKNDDIRINYTINNDTNNSINSILDNAPFDIEKKYNLLQSLLKKEFKDRSLTINEKLQD